MNERISIQVFQTKNKPDMIFLRYYQIKESLLWNHKNIMVLTQLKRKGNINFSSIQLLDKNKCDIAVLLNI
ncbi:MAG: hypothetical protein A2161_22230 [Candidatus Schekmanbacteria bacterium RBG_13_48_7]|uniref:Uncharacterized protein n=1 Tax=Candidatus Schekmanbacteria bacterium RBG_13_48_7 TaxID=1817878 RepID=A0A1F7RYA2_9BACT|nr:MAG: hypothetical protein A2161_22230 [Candidatus Schekmanbacteria bacterium RBG_13_48_7]